MAKKSSYFSSDNIPVQLWQMLRNEVNVGTTIYVKNTHPDSSLKFVNTTTKERIVDHIISRIDAEERFYPERIAQAFKASMSLVRKAMQEVKRVKKLGNHRYCVKRGGFVHSNDTKTARENAMRIGPRGIYQVVRNKSRKGLSIAKREVEMSSYSYKPNKLITNEEESKKNSNMQIKYVEPRRSRPKVDDRHSSNHLTEEEERSMQVRKYTDRD